MSVAGGAFNGGTIFSITLAKTSILSNSNDNAYKILHSFKSNTSDGLYSSGSLIALPDPINNGNYILYGITDGGEIAYGGTIFSYTLANGNYNILYSLEGVHNSRTHQDSLISLFDPINKNNYILYATTTYGGKNSIGTIFSYTLATGVFNILHDFGNQNDGYYPFSSLLALPDPNNPNSYILYGTTTYSVVKFNEK